MSFTIRRFENKFKKPLIVQAFTILDGYSK